MAQSANGRRPRCLSLPCPALPQALQVCGPVDPLGQPPLLLAQGVPEPEEAAKAPSLPWGRNAPVSGCCEWGWEKPAAL